MPEETSRRAKVLENYACHVIIYFQKYIYLYNSLILFSFHLDVFSGDKRHLDLHEDNNFFNILFIYIIKC